MKLRPENSVFINCPFDAQYADLFDAIIFATVCCGFVPRSALESGTVAEPRITRILDALCSSKYSIHDLSRCSGEGDEGLARFNMPLELGMAMARRHLTRAKVKQQHDWLVLVPSGHGHLRFISDLGAFDPKTHDGSVDGVLQPVMVWLASRPGAIRTPTFQEVRAILPSFQTKRRQLAANWGGDVPWHLVLAAATDAVPKF